MEFFRLTEYLLREPMLSLNIPKGLPGVVCDTCGQTWASHNVRIRTNDLENFVEAKRPLPIRWEDFVRLKNFISEHIKNRRIDIDPKLIAPGADIGFLSLRTVNRNNTDFSMPYVFSLVASKSFQRGLTKQGFSGIKFHSLYIDGCESKDYFELEVTGKAGIAMTNPPIEMSDICNLCRRFQYSFSSKDYSVDENQWDGSDFSKFSGPFGGHIIITKNVRDFILKSDYTGIEIRQLSSKT